jgi:thiosulfate reductase cytochrome b subunit
MAAIDCPKCGKPVMEYARFLREAEPHKVLPCGSCGALLARSPRVWLLLVVMSAGLATLFAMVALSGLLGAITPRWLALLVAGVVLVGWILLTNYLGYLLIGWTPAREP